jgi:SHS2 domain-containing protein
LEDIATADIAFKAWGKDLSEVFQAAAEATMNVMIEDLDSIHPLEKKEIIIENEALDMLLFDLLQELIYYKDSNQLLLRIKEAQVEEIPGRYRLKATALGEKLDSRKHQQRVDVKAVTLHRFALERKEDGWEALVILDI